MKILFAIQGTGNGHISRARDIIPHLQQYGELDVLVSGTQSEVHLPQEPKYKLQGLGYVFGKKGGIDYWESFKILRPYDFFRDVFTFPINKYDLIINDFEPVTAWAAKLRGKKVVSMSHQSSFLSSKTPRPAKINKIGELILTGFAPTSHAIGFHFEKYDDFIFTPIIRSEIRQLIPTNEGHYTVYLPAYDDNLLVKHLSKVKNSKWEVFSKHQKMMYEIDNVKVFPINNELYNKSLAGCEGLLTGGGFEAPAEALFLKKKVLCIPMFGQYEQHCNVEGLKRLGVPVVYDMDHNFHDTLEDWVHNQEPVEINFPDITAEVVKHVVETYRPSF